MAGIKMDSLYDVNDLALETGSTVEHPDGRRFNTAGVTGKRQPKAVPAPAAVPPPAAAPDLTRVMKELVAVMNRPVEVHLPPMPAPQVVVKEAKAAPTSWTFKFERNPNGTIKSINATAGK